jgi:transposase
MLYVLKEGCTWHGLPHGFPKWNIVYHYYQMQSAAGRNGEASLFDRVLRELAVFGRVIRGREAKTTMVTIDSKSIKNTNTTEEKGNEAGKRWNEGNAQEMVTLKAKEESGSWGASVQDFIIAA